MIYDNKLHKTPKTFLQNLSTRWGLFFKKNFLPVVEFSNKRSSDPENIRGGGGEGDGY